MAAVLHFLLSQKIEELQNVSNLLLAELLKNYRHQTEVDKVPSPEFSGDLLNHSNLLLPDFLKDYGLKAHKISEIDNKQDKKEKLIILFISC